MTQQSQPASFTNPFKWGKKKEEKKEEAAAAPPPVVETPPATPPVAEPEVAARTYTVKAGDTLWDLAVTYYGDGRKYTKISMANNIADPNSIDIGQVLTIPE